MIRLRSIIILLMVFVCMGQAYAREYPRHRKYALSGFALDDMKGDIRVPVIFVSFEEKNNDNENTIGSENEQSWMKRLNDVCAANHMGDNGSVSDYFEAQSYGQTHVTFERVGAYTAAGKGADYTTTTRSSQIVRQAVVSLKDVDWSRYDKNADGEVDCLLLIYAGHADGDLTQSGIEVRSIYPYRSWLSVVQGSSVTLGGGMKANSYVLAQDLRDKANHVAAINTMCHELSHGIFDLCDYYHGLKSYMGQYDIMCYGFRQTNYSSADNHCCDMTAFNRMYLGWLTPEELTLTGHYSLRPLTQAAEAFVISDPDDENHFFMLENRAKLLHTWDYHLPEAGLILTEIHFSRNAFESHSVNYASTPNIQVIEAATSRGLCIPNDTYLGVSQRTVPYGIDGRTSIPADVSPLFAQQRVTNITIDNDGTISFDYENATAGIHTTNVETDANYYDLQGRRVQPRRGMYIHGRKLKVIR